MTAQQNTEIRITMEDLLRKSKIATQKGALDRAERYDVKWTTMERTLKMLGYKVEIDEVNCTVSITEQ